MAHPKAASPQLMSWTALLPPAGCSAVRAGRRATMEKITTIGLDIAKSVFQVHGVDAAGEVVVRKRLSRARVIQFFAKLPRCLVDIEACNNSHHWARALITLGDDLRFLPEDRTSESLNLGH